MTVLSNKMECFSYERGCGLLGCYIHLYILKVLKEQLAWATDKQIQVI